MNHFQPIQLSEFKPTNTAEIQQFRSSLVEDIDVQANKLQMMRSYSVSQTEELPQKDFSKIAKEFEFNTNLLNKQHRWERTSQKCLEKVSKQWKEVNGRDLNV